MGVGSKKLEYGPGTIRGGPPSSLGSGVGGQTYSNFLASTVKILPSVVSGIPLLGLRGVAWDPYVDMFFRVPSISLRWESKINETASAPHIVAQTRPESTRNVGQNTHEKIPTPSGLYSENFNSPELLRHGLHRDFPLLPEANHRLSPIQLRALSLRVQLAQSRSYLHALGSEYTPEN